MNKGMRLFACLVLTLASMAFVPGASALDSRGGVLASGNSLMGQVTTPAPVASLLAFRPRDDRHRRKETVPDGGSTLAYVLVAGASCLGAIALFSRRRTA